MSTYYEVPLIASPQTLSIALGAATYNLRLTWNVPAQVWVLDVADDGSVPIINGIPLVTGADLLAQYAYLGLGGGLVALADTDPYAAPSFSNLGNEGHLYFVTTP